MRLNVSSPAAVIMLSAAVMFAQNQDVVVRPKEIDTVLVNPGMGIQTFQRFNILAVELSSGEGKAVIKTPADVRSWLPGDAVFEGTIFVPQALRPGNYHFRVGLLDPRTERPAIKLAIEGRQPDGWYDLGTIQVEGQ